MALRRNELVSYFPDFVRVRVCSLDTVGTTPKCGTQKGACALGTRVNGTTGVTGPLDASAFHLHVIGCDEAGQATPEIVQTYTFGLFLLFFSANFFSWFCRGPHETRDGVPSVSPVFLSLSCAFSLN